jgi:hypothetical protein
MRASRAAKVRPHGASLFVEARCRAVVNRGRVLRHACFVARSSEVSRVGEPVTVTGRRVIQRGDTDGREYEPRPPPPPPIEPPP